MRLSFLAVSASIRLIVLTGFCVIAACGDVSNYDIHNESFKRLLNVRSQKKTELIKYLADVHERAKMITSDDVMMSFFWANRHDETNPGRPSAEAEYEMNKHYVNHYGDFYDILFIYSTGFVFHTIKRESDYHKNILTGSFSGSMLAENLRNHSDISFVDFEYYEPSKEPAAFFIVPIRENGLLKGWFVLQYALNQINALLTHREKLGRTGEVYLVNRDFYMLSDSRFIKDDIKLKKRVNTEAVKSAFADKDGNKLLIDYRGINVFSSFELLDIFESQWVIIAEIDEDEVITDYFLKNSDSCVNGILNYLSEQNVNNFIPQKDIRDFIKVDINECAIGRPGELLGTKGVAYCTALAVSFKNRFSYLAHISPIDNSYTDKLARLFLSEQTDLVGAVMRKIMNFDIFRSELRQLEFVIVANHDDSFQKTVEKLTKRNVEISRIKFMFNPGAFRADVFVDPADGSVIVEWFENPREPVSYYQSSDEIPDLGAVVKKLNSL